MCVLQITEEKNASFVDCPWTQFFTENRLKPRCSWNLSGVAWSKHFCSPPFESSCQNVLGLYTRMYGVRKKPRPYPFRAAWLQTCWVPPFLLWPCVLWDITAYRKLQSTTRESILLRHLQEDCDSPNKFALMSRKISFSAILFNTCNDFC